MWLRSTINWSECHKVYWGFTFSGCVSSRWIKILPILTPRTTLLTNQNQTKFNSTEHSTATSRLFSWRVFNWTWSSPQSTFHAFSGSQDGDSTHGFGEFQTNKLGAGGCDNFLANIDEWDELMRWMEWDEWNGMNCKHITFDVSTKYLFSIRQSIECKLTQQTQELISMKDEIATRSVMISYDSMQMGNMRADAMNKEIWIFLLHLFCTTLILFLLCHFYLCCLCFVVCCLCCCLCCLLFVFVLFVFCVVFVLCLCCLCFVVCCLGISCQHTPT